MIKERMPTSQLLKKLLNTKHINQFVERYDNEMEIKPFHEHINSLCVERGCLPAHIIKKAEIERTFGHQLFNGNRKPSRDKVLQLAFGFEMNYTQAQELLKIAKKHALHPKIKRDAVIIFAFENGLKIDVTQETLCELELPILGDEKYE